jgi:putative NADH-flavin reductase
VKRYLAVGGAASLEIEKPRHIRDRFTVGY